jgi:hypothetical protein
MITGTRNGSVAAIAVDAAYVAPENADFIDWRSGLSVGTLTGTVAVDV